jgi:N-acetylglucosamine-6-phosphate deacetylase
MPERLRIGGCRIVTPFVEMARGEILLDGERIAAVLPEGAEAELPEAPRLDAEGRLAVPGLIDLHVQGAGGFDVLDGSTEALEGIARACARHGVTGFLATTVFRPGKPNPHLPAAAAFCRFGRRPTDGAEALGIHIEGPFLAPEKRGMIRPDCLGPASAETLTQVLRLCGGSLAMITIAPELPGCLPLIRSLAAQGIVASFGHSQADYEQTLAGLEAGIRHATHIFNAMPPLHHRAPGPIPALLERRELTAQVIADGVHLHPATLRLLAAALGQERLVLITDGMQAMGLPDGRYFYNGQPYEARDGVARYPDGTLIGTALGLNRLVHRFQAFTGCALMTAVRAASFNPACVLGIQRRTGSLEAGKAADVVLLNPDFTVWRTWKRGRLVYTGPDG